MNTNCDYTNDQILIRPSLAIDCIFGLILLKTFFDSV